MTSKHPMSSKQWLWAFLGTVLLLTILVMGFNFWSDPFGAFGDRFFQWWSYDETMNPRVAKLSYLEQHHDQYDSYIYHWRFLLQFFSHRLSQSILRRQLLQPSDVWR